MTALHLSKDWRVVLLRGPLDPVVFRAEGQPRAYQRAWALAELHGCDLEVDKPHKCMTVDASARYARGRLLPRSIRSS